MRLAHLALLAALALSACASVSERTARSSGVGFVTPGTTAAPAPAEEGSYRAALFEEMSG